MRNRSDDHKWTEEDNLIALDAHFSALGKKGVQRRDIIKKAVSIVNRRSLRDGGKSFDKPESMAMKLRGFDSLKGEGDLGNVSKIGVQLWKKYRDDHDKLKKRMAEIIATLPKK